MMIDLFLLLGFREQTAKYMTAIQSLLDREASGHKEHVATMVRHVYVLSKFFRLHDFFADRDQIAQCPHPLIYHIPYGLENKETGAEKALLEFKGKVPIVARSYDPHSPVKTSPEYLAHHHDLVLTYNKAVLGGPEFQYHLLAFDNYLVGPWDGPVRRKYLCCMILGNKFREDQPLRKGYEVFASPHHGIQNIYAERDRFAGIRDIHIYGGGWPRELPNYYGTLNPFDRKYDMARRYRFSIALENAEAQTYISEKILDSFLTCTVPVYLGAPNVREYIPAGTFIDAREHSDYGELVQHLRDMSHHEYGNFAEAIRTHRGEVFDKFSSFRNIVLPIYTWYQSRMGGVASPAEDEYTSLKRHLGTLRLTRNPDVAHETLISHLRRWKWRIRTLLQG